VKKYELPISYKSWEDALTFLPVRVRYVCDYISGMSDEFLLLNFNETFIPNHGKYKKPLSICRRVKRKS